MGLVHKREGFNSGNALDVALRLIGRVSIFLAPLTAMAAVTLLLVTHGKSLLYAVWLALVACVPVFVLLGVHLLGAMLERVAQPRTPIGIAIFITFQGLAYGALFLLALPWYFVLIPAYLLGRFITAKVRLRRRQQQARLAEHTPAGS
jgi:hypothetical protein